MNYLHNPRVRWCCIDAGYWLGNYWWITYIALGYGDVVSTQDIGWVIIRIVRWEDISAELCEHPATGGGEGGGGGGGNRRGIGPWGGGGGWNREEKTYTINHRHIRMISWYGNAFNISGPLWRELAGGFTSQRDSNAAIWCVFCLHE